MKSNRNPIISCGYFPKNEIISLLTVLLMPSANCFIYRKSGDLLTARGASKMLASKRGFGEDITSREDVIQTFLFIWVSILANLKVAFTT
jgi:hypothetical protein